MPKPARQAPSLVPESVTVSRPLTATGNTSLPRQNSQSKGRPVAGSIAVDALMGIACQNSG